MVVVRQRRQDLAQPRQRAVLGELPPWEDMLTVAAAPCSVEAMTRDFPADVRGLQSVLLCDLIRGVAVTRGLLVAAARDTAICCNAFA